MIEASQNTGAAAAASILAATGLLFLTGTILVLKEEGLAEPEGTAFVGLSALTHLLCALAMIVRARSGSTAYSWLTLVLAVLIIGTYFGGWVAVFVEEEEDGWPVWYAGLPAAGLSAALLWSVWRDGRALKVTAHE